MCEGRLRKKGGECMGVCVCASVCDVSLRTCGAARSAAESKHVLARTNVREMRSEKQMAHLRGGRRNE